MSASPEDPRRDDPEPWDEPGSEGAERTDELVRLLDLERLDVDLYRGSHPRTRRRRLFGGQVAAQALTAAQRSVEEGLSVHSLHSYFLLAGDYEVPVILAVERIRDGRSFATRRVEARQHGRVIYYQTVSFHRHEEGYQHQDVMPEVAGPEDGDDVLQAILRSGAVEADSLASEWGALDMRQVGTSQRGLEPDPRHPAQSRTWMRLRGRVPEDPAVHAALFTFASDVSLLGASLAAHAVDPPQVQMASLDHTIWFHRPFPVDRWWLYDQWSPSAHGGRGLSFGGVFTPDGTLGASVAQEGIIRPRRQG